MRCNIHKWFLVLASELSSNVQFEISGKNLKCQWVFESLLKGLVGSVGELELWVALVFLVFGQRVAVIVRLFLVKCFMTFKLTFSQHERCLNSRLLNGETVSAREIVALGLLFRRQELQRILSFDVDLSDLLDVRSNVKLLGLRTSKGKLLVFRSVEDASI